MQMQVIWENFSIRKITRVCLFINNKCGGNTHWEASKKGVKGKKERKKRNKVEKY